VSIGSTIGLVLLSMNKSKPTVEPTDTHRKQKLTNGESTNTHRKQKQTNVEPTDIHGLLLSTVLSSFGFTASYYPFDIV
jgi:hypothetical protein